MNNTLIEQIDKYIKPENFEVSVDDGDFFITVTTDVSPSILSDVIDRIVSLIKWNDFKYELFDVLMAYYVISLFTDIPIPMKVDENGKEIADYEKCYRISCALNLTNLLCENSIIILNYIELIETNVWRKLDYLKTLQSNEALMTLCDKAYDVLSNMDALFENVDIDYLNSITQELGNVTEKLSLIGDAPKKNA